jgi:hypothetical protein
MTFLEEHVRDMPSGSIDDEALHLADLAVARVQGLAAADADLSRWKDVACLHRARQGDRGVRATLQTEVRPVVRLVCGVGVIATAAREEVCLLRRGELLERGERAPQVDVAGTGFHHVEWDEPSQPAAVLGLDHQMREGPGHRVDDHPAHPAAGAVVTRRRGPDRESGVCHAGLLCRQDPTGAAPRPRDLSRHAAPQGHQPRRSTSQRSTTSSPSTR